MFTNRAKARMPDVVLENVTKLFPAGVVAVDQLGLHVRHGELLVLVGPSGCGKTTTLRLIAGLEDPTSGRVRIGERDVTKLPPAERDVGVVFQRPALYPHRSVRDNLALGLALRQGDSWWRRLISSHARKQHESLSERVLETAELLGLAQVLDRRPTQLSGGQQQRVALGRALVRRPGVILLDEPLSNLDTALRQELRRELHLLQRQLQATMIYVTHDPVEALCLGDRIAVMERGRIVQTDRPEAVFQRPVNRFVAGFVGWPAMNFLDGRLERRDGRLMFVGCAGALPVLPAVAELWAPWAGQSVTLGIRPEDVEINAEAGPGTWPMQVRLVESLGHSQLVTLAYRSCEMTAWLRGGCQLLTGLDTMSAEKTVMVYLPLEKGRLFDRASGAALVGCATG